jgi:hypothetical protein
MDEAFYTWLEEISYRFHEDEDLIEVARKAFYAGWEARNA